MAEPTEGGFEIERAHVPEASVRRTIELQLKKAVVYPKPATQRQGAETLGSIVARALLRVATWPIIKIKEEWQWGPAGCLLAVFVPFLVVLYYELLALVGMVLAPVAIVFFAPLIVSFSVWSDADTTALEKIGIFAVYCLLNFGLGYAAVQLLKRLVASQVQAVDRLRAESARHEADAVRAIAREYFQTLERLNRLIQVAETALTRAENEFGQKAFGSFWDGIDEAIRKLVEFEIASKKLRESRLSYETAISKLVADGNEHTFPTSLRVSATDVPDLRKTLARLTLCVRQGETDFQFASILEQRTTRRVLMAGFAHVGAAIDHLQANLGATLANIQLILATR